MIESIKNTTSAASETLPLGGRFHYWSGQSGTRYIFSIYKPDACPPLPGAVYVVANRRPNGSRDALAVGRFPAVWECASHEVTKLVKATGGTEVHVHLLAESDRDAEDIVCDLKPALDGVVRLRPADTPPPKITKLSENLTDNQVDLFALSSLGAQQATAA